MIYQHVSVYDFRDAFRAFDRADQFSYDGLAALYEYLCDYCHDTGESIELDVIALCCDYVESTLHDILTDYAVKLDTVDDALAWLRDCTQVIDVRPADTLAEYRVIYQAF